MNKISLFLLIILLAFSHTGNSQEIMTPEQCIDHIESSEGNVSDEVKEHWLHRLKKSSSLNRDITFYGKVVDENGTGIPAAEIDFRVDYLECWIAMGQDGKHLTAQVTSDSDGRFSISGYQGFNLAIYEITKEGFVFNTRKSFVYNSVMDRGADLHRPDSEQPVVFVGEPIED